MKASLDAAVRYAVDRDAALIQFIKTDDFGHIERLFARYGMEIDVPRDVAKMAAYKAVQGCVNVRGDIKALAMEKMAALRAGGWNGKVDMRGETDE